MKFIKLKQRSGLNDAIINAHLLCAFFKSGEEKPKITYVLASGAEFSEVYATAFEREARYEEICQILEAN